MVTSRNAVAFVNIHPQKSKWVTAKIILVSPASILVGEWLQRQRHIGAWPLYILFKCDVRHCLHCFVCTDTHLFNFTKGKTDLVNQRWRRTTCLKHQCYDVGCYPCEYWDTFRKLYFFKGLLKKYNFLKVSPYSKNRILKIECIFLKIESSKYHPNGHRNWNFWKYLLSKNSILKIEWKILKIEWVIIISKHI